MKVAILFQGDLKKVSIGGVAEYVKNLIRFKGNNEVTLFGVCHKGEFAVAEPVQREVMGSEYTFTPLCDDSRRPLSLWFTLSLRRQSDNLDGFDVIYCQRPEYCLAFSERAVRGRLFQIIHGSSAYTVRPMNCFAAKAYLAIERSSIRKCARTFVIMKRDEVGLGYYRRLYPGMAGKFVYGRIPVDTGVFHVKDRASLRATYGIDPGRFVITFAGRVEDYPKRVLLFPRIVGELRDLDPLFVVVGDGSSLGVLRESIEKAGLDHCFNLVGYCGDRGRLADYNALSDMTINISAFEGTCTSSLESIACGTPVLSTDVGDIRVFIPGKENGVVIPNGGDETIVSDAVAAIRWMHDFPVAMNYEYRAYSCENTFPELFGIFDVVRARR